jgi:hypothetical protein
VVPRPVEAARSFPVDLSRSTCAGTHRERPRDQVSIGLPGRSACWRGVVGSDVCLPGRRNVPTVRRFFLTLRSRRLTDCERKEEPMHGLIYLIGLIVVILAILSFFGLR